MQILHEKRLDRCIILLIQFESHLRAARALNVENNMFNDVGTTTIKNLKKGNYFTFENPTEYIKFSYIIVSAKEV